MKSYTSIADFLTDHLWLIDEHNAHFYKGWYSSLYEGIMVYRRRTIPFSALAGHTVESFQALALTEGWVELEAHPSAPSPTKIDFSSVPKMKTVTDPIREKYEQQNASLRAQLIAHVGQEKADELLAHSDKQLEKYIDRTMRRLTYQTRQAREEIGLSLSRQQARQHAADAVIDAAIAEGCVLLEEKTKLRARVAEYDSWGFDSIVILKEYFASRKRNR